MIYIYRLFHYIHIILHIVLHLNQKHLFLLLNMISIILL